MNSLVTVFVFFVNFAVRVTFMSSVVDLVIVPFVAIAALSKAHEIEISV
jgi:hypothetical protein